MSEPNYNSCTHGVKGGIHGGCKKCSPAFAYSKALAGESVSDEMKAKWDPKSETYIGLTDDEIKRYAKTVAYKVAANLGNGFAMDPADDPLTYIDCGSSSDVDEPPPTGPSFSKELEHLINCHSVENGSNTPDFILAEYMMGCLRAYEQAVEKKEAWFKK